MDVPLTFKFHFMQYRLLLTGFFVFITFFSISQTIEMPYNRQIAAAGKVLSYGNPSLENHTLDVTAIPNRSQVAVEDRYGIAVVDVLKQKIIYRWDYTTHPPFQAYMSTYSGIKSFIYNDTTWLAWSAAQRDSDKSSVMLAAWTNDSISTIKTISFEKNKPGRNALPNDVLFAMEQGNAFLYVVLNGNNQLRKYRLADLSQEWSAATGNAPFALCKAGNTLWVTNWAGPQTKDTTQDAAGIPWGNAYTNIVTGATKMGSVTVLSAMDGQFIKEIETGLHPNAICASKDGKNVFVCNGNSDDISMLSTKTLQLETTLPVGLFGLGGGYNGSSPNALLLHPDGKKLFVANGLDNAIAVVQLPQPALKIAAKVLGYIPTQAYPSGLALYQSTLVITNLEAVGAGVLSSPGNLKRNGKIPADAFSIHKQLASISLITLPNPQQLAAYTRLVNIQNRKSSMEQSLLPPRAGVAPVPVPERIGEPSVFKHVVYIIKENKTYDQVFGDLPIGNGDSSLCIFGERITPNQHKIALQYGVMDHFYASGKSSAEGHQWTDGAMVSDYVEKNVRAWFRSYPHRQEDALVYNKAGFIWNHASNLGKSVRVYGEACTTQYDEKLNWKAIYTQYKNGQSIPLHNTTTIAPLRPLIAPDFPDCDNLVFSDQMRADVFIKEWKNYEANHSLPQLLLLSLPNDHTSGTSANWPTPNAMVADNDLAVGRILEMISHSKYWDSTVVFITEDDSQGGWDHISPYRTIGMVASAYNTTGVIAESYNQTSMLRTIEQILGIPPMNVIDATAKTMTACFSNQKNGAGSVFSFVPNNIPLDQMNIPPAQLQGKAKTMALLSEKEVYNEVDGGKDDLMNQVLWFYAKGNLPYPKRK